MIHINVGKKILWMYAVANAPHRIPQFIANTSTSSSTQRSSNEWKVTILQWIRHDAFVHNKIIRNSQKSGC